MISKVPGTNLTCMGTRPTAALSGDRRSAMRDRCVLRCRITHGPWKEVVDAVIRDLHPEGARLRLNSRVVLTGQVQLDILPSGHRYAADVAWQRGDEVGVRLIATLDETVERQIESLRLAGVQLRRAGFRRPDDGTY